MGEAMLQHHGALDGGIAGHPLAGPERTLLGGVHIAPVGDRAGRQQPIPGLVEGDTSGPGPVSADAAT